MTVDVAPLTEEIARSVAGELLELDGPYVSDRLLELWTPENLMRPGPDKWRLSAVAYDEGRPVGYRIVSGAGKVTGYAHSHRTAVLESRRRSGIATALLDVSIRLARGRDYLGMTGMLHPWNEGSRRFLLATGWIFSGEHRNGNEVWVLEFERSGR